MHLQLISTKRCPFVQRSIITLNYKGIEHEMTYVDLDDPPGWFKDISPFGKVPLLRVDNDTVIFESAVINEFLDEITPGQLHPADPLQRALNRSWIEFGGNCCGLTFQLMVAPDQQSYEAIVSEISDNLQRVEKVLSEGPFFNGADFSLIDAAYAPVFIRLDIFRELFGLRITDSLPRMSDWQDQLLKMPAVQKARVPELPDLFRKLIFSRDAYVRSLL
ncbi:MAG: glutathione S-transferase family protein [Gammaproteobacteria bacterium]|nr:glutathione S-transferase family protein [Gammaproteobacteria bacterium]